MDSTTVVIAIAIFIAGVLLGRATAPKTRTTVVYPPAAAPDAAADAAPGAQVQAALRAGRKIDAIRLYREQHGVGLVRAKQAVEAIEGRLPR